MLANYYTAEQIASILDVDVKRVWDWKRAKLITPALTKGEEQYTRADVVKLAVLLSLKEIFGEKHGAPARLISAHENDVITIAAQLDTYIGPEPIRISLHAEDVELRVNIAYAIREKLAQVPA